MGMYRYWRLIGLSNFENGDINISQLQLHDASGRVDNLGSISCTDAPDHGLLENLRDGLFSTYAGWTKVKYGKPAFSISWDLSVAKDIIKIKIGAGVARSEFLENTSLQGSTDGIEWFTQFNVVNLAWVDSSMAYTGVNEFLVESFDVDAGGYQAVIGGLTSNWTSGKVSLAAGVDQNFSIFKSIGSFNKGVDDWFELDIKILSDSAGLMHLGPYVGSDTATGLRIYSINNGTGVDSWNQGGYIGGAGGVEGAPGNPFMVGGVYTLRVERTETGLYSWKIDGIEYTHDIVDPNTEITAYVGLFLYGVAVDVLEIRRQSLIVENSGILTPRASSVSSYLINCIPAVELPDTTAQSHPREHPFFDVYNGGLGIITGTVKEKNTPINIPLYRRVLLVDERSQMAIRETWSDAATGDYEFRGVKQGVKYTVISYDHLHNYRAVIADNQDAT